MRPFTQLLFLLAATLSAQDAPLLVQPAAIPGKIAITPQPLPAVAAILARDAPDRPVYGLYIWKM